MASLYRKAGRWTIQFDRDGARRWLRVPVRGEREATRFAEKVEALIAAKDIGVSPEPDVVAWLAKLPRAAYRRLVRVGLAEPKQEDAAAIPAVRLGAFLDDLIRSRADVKPATLITFENVRENLVGYFGADKSLRDITPGDADGFRLSLATSARRGRAKEKSGEEPKAAGLAENTVRRRTGIARQFFRVAVRRKLIESNPFDGLAAAVRGNPKRSFFVTREMAAKILDACPDRDWQTIFALCRFGGLRCPSEVLAVRWQDVDWARSRITIHASKTEHHDDGGIRQVPLFPELLPILREGFEAAEPGTEYVVNRYRDTTQNLRTQFERIAKRAGLPMWPKPFHNLRSSRETELAREYPLHVIAAWIGHDPRIALEHYAQVRDEDYERATAAPEVPLKAPLPRPETLCTVPASEADKPHSKHRAIGDKIIQTRNVGVAGLEPATSSV